MSPFKLLQLLGWSRPWTSDPVQQHGFYELILNKAKGKSGPVMLDSLNFHVVMLGKLSRGIGMKRTSISSPLLDEG
ncbi:hypothetical protein EZV62_028066 [Acer yangbiense]|uniref:Uncharacterized protein n=1 Tax=Acer yangbiense TaxID=1000413 RepID=A0A5C7GPE3_9ROSI|nr:hypothetical protein EZV62_028066 [Acer yangbiense]